jgi:hypothetical protein
MEWMLHDPDDEPARFYPACAAADLALAADRALADRAGQNTGHDAASVCDRIAGHKRHYKAVAEQPQGTFQFEIAAGGDGPAPWPPPPGQPVS